MEMTTDMTRMEVTTRAMEAETCMEAGVTTTTTDVAWVVVPAWVGTRDTTIPMAARGGWTTCTMEVVVALPTMTRLWADEAVTVVATIATGTTTRWGPTATTVTMKATEATVTWTAVTAAAPWAMAWVAAGWAMPESISAWAVAMDTVWRVVSAAATDMAWVDQWAAAVMAVMGWVVAVTAVMAWVVAVMGWAEAVMEWAEAGSFEFLNLQLVVFSLFVENDWL
mmetsp:Transcript_15616/g.26928  ORF Transcript_15616/g.26928 Transcript_15616/m.26928 type:complete len:224 (-) Transcript_15616:1071-1742(-)